MWKVLYSDRSKTYRYWQTPESLDFADANLSEFPVEDELSAPLDTPQVYSRIVVGSVQESWNVYGCHYCPHLLVHYCLETGRTLKYFWNKTMHQATGMYFDSRNQKYKSSCRDFPVWTSYSWNPLENTQAVSGDCWRVKSLLHSASKTPSIWLEFWSDGNWSRWFWCKDPKWQCESPKTQRT